MDSAKFFETIKDINCNMTTYTFPVIIYANPNHDNSDTNAFRQYIWVSTRNKAIFDSLSKIKWRFDMKYSDMTIDVEAMSNDKDIQIKILEGLLDSTNRKINNWRNKMLKALIAVRSGSTRVPDKNTRSFAGSTLLDLKIQQLLRIPQLDGIVDNSNDDTMLEITKSYGVETIKRDSYYASNIVSMSEVYKNMAENINADDIAYINVTNPLLKDETIISAINKYHQLKNEGIYNSLNSGHLIKEFMFKDNIPLNYDLKNQPRSQDLPDIAALNFAISILPREEMIQNKNVVGSKPNIFIIDEIEATDIDNLIDFEFAEYMYKKG